MELTREQMEMLEFERRWPNYGRGKIQAVEEFFALSHRDYERELEAVLALPAARAYDPDLVRSAVRYRRGMKWFNDKQRNEWV